MTDLRRCASLVKSLSWGFEEIRRLGGTADVAFLFRLGLNDDGRHLELQPVAGWSPPTHL